MTDISQHLPKSSPIVDAIYAYHKKKGDAEPTRGYLGASIIGHSCDRFLWFNFRGCCKPNFNGRMYRLFETGDLAESRFVAELRAIGCVVHDRDESGNQFEVSAVGGHFSGHMDGCATNTPRREKSWMGLEFKTHNDKSFNKLKKVEVKEAKPQHYAQMQVYMKLSGLRKFLYIAVNKNDESLYCEIVRYDAEAADLLMARAERIIKATAPPERISNRPDYYECSYCDAKEICWNEHGREPCGIGYWVGYLPALPLPTINCRQCCHSTPTMDGKAAWQCERHKRGLSPADQSKACDDHLVLPGLISFAQPVNAGDVFIEFVNLEPAEPFVPQNTEQPKVIWRHGKGEGAFSTKELMQLSPEQLTNPTINKVKEIFDGTVERVWKDEDSNDGDTNTSDKSSASGNP